MTIAAYRGCPALNAMATTLRDCQRIGGPSKGDDFWWTEVEVLGSGSKEPEDSRQKKESDNELLTLIRLGGFSFSRKEGSMKWPVNP
jgi:hypothetical protein